MAAKDSIERVPATVASRGAKEVGRGVEYAQEAAEADLLKRMSNRQGRQPQVTGQDD